MPIPKIPEEFDIGGGATFSWDPSTAKAGRPTRDKLQLPIGSDAGGIPIQPQTTPRGGGPKYFLPNDSLYPTQVRDVSNWQDYDTAQKEMWKQVIPTSINLRNQNLKTILDQYQTPMQQLFAGQGVGAAADARAKGISDIESGAASRGLVNSGAYDISKRDNDVNYLKNVANATESGREQDRQRKAQGLQQILSVPENDLRFYEAIRSGTIPAGSLFGDNTAQSALQFGQGLQTLVKTLVSMGAGGMGGGAMGAGGGAGGGGALGGLGGGALGNLGSVGGTMTLLNNTNNPYHQQGMVY